jgi:hypothetical protein
MNRFHIVTLRTRIFNFFEIIVVFQECGKIGLHLVEDFHDSPPPTRILFTLHIVQRSRGECDFLDGHFTNRTWEFLQYTLNQ